MKSVLILLFFFTFETISGAEGEFIGRVWQVDASKNEVLVQLGNRADKVKMGTKLYVYAGATRVILSATFPTHSAAKCKITAPPKFNISGLQKNMTVYLYLPAMEKKKPAVIALRYDGVYMSRANDYYQYVRFYADGSLVEMSSSGKPQEIAKWFNSSSPNVSKGKYALNQASIQFSATDSFGTVDYVGTIEGLRIKLATFSHINGHKGTYEYNFIELPELATDSGSESTTP